MRPSAGRGGASAEGPSVESVLQNPTVRQVHAQPKRRYIPIITEPGVFQADLMFFPDSITKQNSFYNGLSNFVEIGTRMAWSYPIKSKDAPEILRTLKLFIVDCKRLGKKVVRVETDKGGEYHSVVDEFFRSNNIVHSEHQKPATGIVERYNGTIRNFISRWLTVQRTRRWVDHVQAIVDYYNNRRHSTTGYPPSLVTPEIEQEIRARLASKKEARAAVAAYGALLVGDRVRIRLDRKQWDKGRQRWSDNVHIIDHKDGFNFYVQGSDVPHKYNDLLRVPFDSKDVKQDPIVAEEEEAVRHGRALHREELAPNPRAGAEIAMQVMAGPQARPTRERRAPARFDVNTTAPQLARSTKPKKQVAAQPVWEVEAVGGTKMIRGKKHWLTFWRGYGPEDATWEPRASFDQDPDTYPSA